MTRLAPEVRVLLGAWQKAGRGVRQVLSGEGDLSWQQARAAYVDQMEALLPAPQGVVVAEVELDGTPTLLIEPDRRRTDCILFYIHGGGYVHSAARAYRGLAGHLANRLGARVYVPNYRQAPEHPFPTLINDVFRAYQALISLDLHAGHVALAVDSTGGALVVTIMRKARDASVALPVAAAVFSPWADLTHTGPSARSRDGLDPVNSVKVLDRLARTFLEDALATDPDASPIHADVRGLSPTLIQVGENEVMLSGATALAERLSEQRVRTTLEVWPGMFHVWHRLAGHMAEADEALDNAATFLAREYDRAAGPKGARST